MTVSSSLTILTVVAEDKSRAVWVDQESLRLLRVDEWADKYYIHIHGVPPVVCMQYMYLA